VRAPISRRCAPRPLPCASTPARSPPRPQRRPPWRPSRRWCSAERLLAVRRRCKHNGAYMPSRTLGCPSFSGLIFALTPSHRSLAARRVASRLSGCSQLTWWAQPARRPCRASSAAAVCASWRLRRRRDNAQNDPRMAPEARLTRIGIADEQDSMHGAWRTERVTPLTQLRNAARAVRQNCVSVMSARKRRVVRPTAALSRGQREHPANVLSTAFPPRSSCEQQCALPWAAAAVAAVVRALRRSGSNPRGACSLPGPALTRRRAACRLRRRPRRRAWRRSLVRRTRRVALLPARTWPGG